MADVEPIIIAHYQAVREEEMERLRHRDKYIVWYITLTAASVGIFIKNNSWWGLLLAIPLLSCVVGMLYAHTDATLGSLSQWLRYRYTEMLNEYRSVNNISYDIHHWDGSSVHKEYVAGLSFGLRYIVVSLIIGGVGLLSISVAWESIRQSLPYSSTIIIIIEFIFVSIGSVFPLWAWRKRIKQA